ncbi:hypothetical protein M3Y97_00045500 [Aphelenchoides bicaudatus]|nr:hypothetical protein M3Y97_00045500 [Aphelenchoides bicaudatus]
MLNVICNIAAVDGKTARYTIKMREDSSVQHLIDRIQTRFNEPMTKIQRNTTGNEGPAEILFFDEPIDVGDEFWITFSRANSESSINNLEEVPTFDQMPQLIASNQPLPPSAHGSPLQLTSQPTSLHSEQKPDVPTINTEQIIMPLTPALSHITVDAVIKGTKAEQIVQKLKRNESIEPSERQLLVRVAGRWLMEVSLTKYKPSAQERSYFAKNFFGALPNFKNYDIRDFHNSQSRGFLDVFIYNERDRKTRSGELNRPSINPDTVVKSLKRKHNRINMKDEHNPFINLVVPPESVTTLTRLELDEHAFENRYIEIVSKEFGISEAPISLARTWEDSVAPKILQYIKKINPEFYQRTINGQELTANVISNAALQMIPFLVRRLHRENSNTKVTSFIVKLETATDDQILAHMRGCNDPGPFIVTDEKTYLLVVMDKILTFEQNSSAALEKLIKSYFVYNLQLTQLRKAIINLLLICLGIQKSMTSSFKEVCQCIMSCQPN